MALTIKINGAELENFIRASVVSDIGAVTRAFTFSSTATADDLFPIRVGDLVQIAADGIDILEGYVESLDMGYSDKSHDFTISGRSLLGDLVDSTVSAQTEINGTTLEDIAKTVMRDIGLEPLVSNQAGDIAGFDDITSAEVGGNAFEFLEKYSRKRQVLLTTDGKGTLVFARAGTTKAPDRLQHIKAVTVGNNIIKSRLSIDHTERFNLYTVHSQLNPGLAALGLSPEDISGQKNSAADSAIRPSRKLEINAEESMDSFTAGDRAKWEANIRAANSINYTATIVGHSVDGVLWQPNTLVAVKDEFAKVSADMLIRRVIYGYGLDVGSTVSLSMTTKQAFTLEIEQSERDANIEDTGGAFILS